MSDRRAEERDYVQRVDTSHGSQFSTTELAIQVIQKLQARLVAYVRVAEAARRVNTATSFGPPYSKERATDILQARQALDAALSALDTEGTADA